MIWIGSFIVNLTIIEVMKNILITIFFFIVLPQTVLAEIWDLGLGIIIMPGRMENYVPTQIEIGASSVKGYGLSVSKQATQSFDNLNKDEESGGNNYTSKFELSSDALHLFYRFENYDRRWDIGLMHNRNIYTGKIEKTGSSAETGEIEINVSYTGPCIQYSNTLTGYETDDWYYGLRLFSISSNKPDSSSYNIIVSDDTYMQDYNSKMKNFINDNNPKTVTGFNITFGWRL